jgi:hypothetical protein
MVSSRSQRSVQDNFFLEEPPLADDDSDEDENWGSDWIEDRTLPVYHRKNDDVKVLSKNDFVESHEDADGNVVGKEHRIRRHLGGQLASPPLNYRWVLGR